MGLFNFGKEKDVVLEERIEKLQQKLLKKQYEYDKEIAKKKSELEVLKNEISIANDDLGMQEYGFFTRQYKFSDSLQYKKLLDDYREQEKLLVKTGLAGVITAPLTFNNSIKKGQAIQKQLIKAAIRGFNGEADALLVKVTPSNLENKKRALSRSYDQLNKMYSRNFIKITSEYFELKLKELEVSVEYDLKKQEEKELLRDQREKEKEDKKLQAEIAKRRKEIEKDRTHFYKMIKNVEEMMLGANEREIIELKKQLFEYQQKLLELDSIEEDIDYREGHASAGYVYVISNIGSFGSDIYKIGVTRRLDPLERIRELSSASVPFQFDVHALVFSEQAFSLEAELHNELSHYRVNKVNNRKEYFKVQFSKIKEVLDRHKELTIELNEKAEAFEYRQGLELQNKKA